MRFSWLFILALIWSCSDNSSDIENTNPTEPSIIIYNWIVAEDEVLGNFDPFPLAQNPILFPASTINFVNDDTQVVLISFGEEVRIYPNNYVHAFEVVNDVIGNNHYAITYCPITSSIVGYNRDFDSKTFTLRASGYLYKENQVLHDATTDTFWSQMELRCIKGIYQGENYNTFNLIETNWKIAKEYFPDAIVFTNASVSKNSSQNKSKKTPDNDEHIYGIVETSGKTGTVYAYNYDMFIDEITMYTKTIEGKNIIIIGNKELNFITSYVNDERIVFTPILNEFPTLMKDSNDNVWNVFGVATSGPRKGQQLDSPTGFFASWWAWESFYTNIDVQE